MFFQMHDSTPHFKYKTTHLLSEKINGQFNSRKDDVNYPPRSSDLTPTLIQHDLTRC